MRREISRVVQAIYDRTLRPLLPRKVALFNGVPVRAPRLLDASDVLPDYEQPLVSAIDERVEVGDKVTTIGGGWGVSAVYAGRSVGENGKVTVYEAGADQVEHVRETLTLSSVADRVDVLHAVVGPGDNVYGRLGPAVAIAPDELEPCDVLILDCEGAEIEILRDMTIRPETVVVESHHMYDAPADDVQSLLEEANYEILREQAESSPDGDLPVFTAGYLSEADV